jgi:hypothetical protein
MNSFFLYLASGDSLYAGIALLLLVVVLSPYLRPWQRRWRNGAAWLALDDRTRFTAIPVDCRCRFCNSISFAADCPEQNHSGEGTRELPSCNSNGFDFVYLDTFGHGVPAPLDAGGYRDAL